MAFVAPLLSPCPTVVTVLDLSFLLYPSAFKSLKRTYLRWMTALSVRRARQVIAISESTRRDVIARLHVPAERVQTVYCGIDPRFRPLPAAEVEAPTRARAPLPVPAPVVVAAAPAERAPAPRVKKAERPAKRSRHDKTAASADEEPEDLDALSYDELVSRAHTQARRDPRAALMLYGKAAQKYPNRAEVNGWIGGAYMQLGQLEAARASYAQCTRKVPGYGPCSYGQARALDKLGRRGEAKGHYESYLARHPDGSDSGAARQRLAAMGGGGDEPASPAGSE